MTGEPDPSREPLRIEADRFCRACGGNLIGCELAREPYYNLLAAACPACGAVNSVQTYPHLTEWELRWRRLIAGFWFLIVACLFLFGAAGLFAWSCAVGFEGFDQAVWRLYDQYEFEVEGGADVEGISFEQWWGSQSMRSFIEAQGGWWGVLDDDAVALALVGLLFAAALGGFLSLALVHMRTRRRLLVCAAPFIVGHILGIMLVFGIISSSRFMPDALVVRHLVIPATLGLGAVYGLTMLIMVWLGRAIARRLIVILIPPRLRGPIAFLWTCDHLTPPVGGGP